MIIQKMLNQPIYYARLIIAIIRGSLYILYYSVFNSNVRIGFPFIVYSRVRIDGPGQVTIGKKCTVVENVFRGLSVVTLSPEATVTIGGEGCLLGGLTIRCHKKITIGNNVMTAVSLIQDALFVNNDMNMFLDKNDKHFKSTPITIGNNVWLGGHCCILGGSEIADDCVLSACSMTYKAQLNEYSLGSGNPLKRPLPIDKLLGLRK